VLLLPEGLILHGELIDIPLLRLLEGLYLLHKLLGLLPQLLNPALQGTERLPGLFLQVPIEHLPEILMDGIGLLSFLDHLLPLDLPLELPDTQAILPDHLSEEEVLADDGAVRAVQGVAAVGGHGLDQLSDLLQLLAVLFVLFPQFVVTHEQQVDLVLRVEVALAGLLHLLRDLCLHLSYINYKCREAGSVDS
jgi:hypothetical protein